ncbi:hypothetical protein [Burkholderia sp. BCC0322]|uniref:hypothetical protein n=1 Tax=unclassified Burkholderia TaxID=2613784 RepID=UPI00158CD70D|nr:hypothetical protein [Burkholderia sp. BCC0322]
MVVKKRDVGDADQFVIIRAFTRMPRAASANFPDAAALAAPRRGGLPIVRRRPACAVRRHLRPVMLQRDYAPRFP